MVGSSLAPKWPILVPFCGMDHQKSNFSLILALFLLEAVEASRCYFFENWWMKLKCPLLLKPLATIVQENSQSFYPSEPFRISHFTMRHPVLCDNCSGTFTLRIRTYFASFVTDQNVLTAMKGCVPEPVCLWPGFVVYYRRKNLRSTNTNHDLRNCHPSKLLTYFVMIALVHFPFEFACILYYLSLTKMYWQQRRVMYQQQFDYDLDLLFIT